MYHFQGIKLINYFYGNSCFREDPWFQTDLPEYLFPSSQDQDASIINLEIVKEICEVRSILLKNNKSP